MTSDRSALGFSQAAASAFRFLEERFGFRITERQPTRLRYENRTTFVNLYHGRLSYELGFEVGPLFQNQGAIQERFILEEILENAGKPAAGALRVARTAEEVASGLA